MSERISQIGSWVHQKKIDLAAGAVLTLAAAACGGEGEAQIPPTDTPNIPPATATLEMPKPSPTVEAPAFSFGHYDVFQGSVPGGSVIIATFSRTGESSSPMIYVFSAKAGYCTDQNTFNYRFEKAAPLNLQKPEFNVDASLGRKMEGKLVDSTTINGRVLVTERTVSGGTCSADEIPFTANKIGNGKDVFLQAYIAASSKLGSSGTPAQFQTVIERNCACKLPEN